MFDIKAIAKHLSIGALQHLGGLIAGGIIVGLGLLLTWFVSFGERNLTRGDWVILTLGFAVALTVILCGLVWAYPRCREIWREWSSKKENSSVPEEHPPVVKHTLSDDERAQMVKVDSLIVTILNQTKEMMDYVHDIKHKGIAFLHHPSSAEAVIIDLGHCREKVEVLRSKVDLFCANDQQYREFSGVLRGSPLPELITAIEHFRSALENLTQEVELRKGAKPASLSYLFQPFVTEVDLALSDLRRWIESTMDMVWQIREYVFTNK